MENLNTIIGIIAGFIVICGGIFVGLKWGRATLRRIWLWLTRRSSKLSRETIRIIPKRGGQWWHMGSSGGQPAMQIVSRWYVTNITNEPVLLLRTSIFPFKMDGTVIVRHPEREIYGRYPILPRETSEASADFWVQPPTLEEGQVLKATIILIDQFGNEHRVKDVTFHYM